MTPLFHYFEATDTVVGVVFTDMIDAMSCVREREGERERQKLTQD